MFTYIKRAVRGYYLELEEKLTSDLYDNLGETYEDFLQNKFVLLSEEQVKFHEENPNASIKEVWDMELTPGYERTINDAKYEMLSKIDSYDNSDEVNSFTINNSISAWFTPNERTNYKNSIDSAKLLGVKELSLFIGDMSVTIPTERAEQMLAAIQLYADACFMVTKQHKLIVNNMTEIYDVDEYNYKVGYPEKLNFNVDA